MKKVFFISVVLFYTIQATSQILLDSTYIKVTPILQNLRYPWEIIWGPDNTIWMTRLGAIYRVNPQTGVQHRILNTPGDYYSEGSRQTGLVVHPDFNTNHYVYIDYNYVGAEYYDYTYYDDQHATSNIYLKIVRYIYNSGSDALENPKVLFDGLKINDGYRDGGKLIISDNHIFITIGDSKQVKDVNNRAFMKPGSAPQNLDSYYGKVLRLNMDGSVPEDNPFAKPPYTKTPRNLVWTYGHRHSQGLVVGNGNKIYYVDHGRDNDDEFGIIEKGKNYGWPLIEGLCDSLHEQMSCDTILNHKEPIHIWNPNVAPSNMDYVGDSPIGEFENSILVGTLTANGYGNHIAVLTLNEAGNEIIRQRSIYSNQYGRIRDLCVSPTGDVYFVTSNVQAGVGGAGDDKIMKISFDSKNGITGVTETIQSDIVLYPNPLGRERKIYLKLPFSKGVVQLYNASGVVINTYSTETDSLVIDASHLKTGVFFIRYRTATQLVVRKLIVD